jgi:hypothetical protein
VGHRWRSRLRRRSNASCQTRRRAAGRRVGSPTFFAAPASTATPLCTCTLSLAAFASSVLLLLRPTESREPRTSESISLRALRSASLPLCPGNKTHAFKLRLRLHPLAYVPQHRHRRGRRSRCSCAPPPAACRLPPLQNAAVEQQRARLAQDSHELHFCQPAGGPLPRRQPAAAWHGAAVAGRQPRVSGGHCGCGLGMRAAGCVWDSLDRWPPLRLHTELGE